MLDKITKKAMSEHDTKIEEKHVSTDEIVRDDSVSQAQKTSCPESVLEHELCTSATNVKQYSFSDNFNCSKQEKSRKNVNVFKPNGVVKIREPLLECERLFHDDTDIENDTWEVFDTEDKQPLNLLSNNEENQSFSYLKLLPDPELYDSDETAPKGHLNAVNNIQIQYSLSTGYPFSTLQSHLKKSFVESESFPEDHVKEDSLNYYNGNDVNFEVDNNETFKKAKNTDNFNDLSNDLMNASEEYEAVHPKFVQNIENHDEQDCAPSNSSDLQELQVKDAIDSSDSGADVDEAVQGSDCVETEGRQKITENVTTDSCFSSSESENHGSFSAGSTMPLISNYETDASDIETDMFDTNVETFIGNSHDDNDEVEEKIEGNTNGGTNNMINHLNLREDFKIDFEKVGETFPFSSITGVSYTSRSRKIQERFPQRSGTKLTRKKVIRHRQYCKRKRDCNIDEERKELINNNSRKEEVKLNMESSKRKRSTEKSYDDKHSKRRCIGPHSGIKMPLQRSSNYNFKIETSFYEKGMSSDCDNSKRTMRRKRFNPYTDSEIFNQLDDHRSNFSSNRRNEIIQKHGKADTAVVNGDSGFASKESTRCEDQTQNKLSVLSENSPVKLLYDCLIPDVMSQKMSQHFYQQLKVLRRVIEDEEQRVARRVAKDISRELYISHQSYSSIFGLNSYFDRLNNGPPPTTREQMQYEWLRLSSFHNYTGQGNALALARNGFYHDHNNGPLSTRCYLCEAQYSEWEMLDNIQERHRRLSPNCPFHENHEDESLNVSITYGETDNLTTRSGAANSTEGSNLFSTVSSSVASSTPAAVTELSQSLKGTSISNARAGNNGGESISQQPTEDRESDRSMLALSQPRTLRALGRTGHSYASIMAPTRNNVASGARSNVGVDPGRDVSRSTSSQIPGIRPSSILGGPVGAGAFAGLNSSALTPVSRAKENLQQSNVPTPAVEAATGARQSNPAPGAGGRTDPNITVVVDNPKHPDYVNVESRVNTYQGWPDYLDQTPRQMSEAGFFFVGVADFTRCFCCGGGLRNWEPGDDPVLEHTRWFPRCEYINKLKGERYVAAVQRRHEQHMAEQQRQQTELAQRRDESRNDPDPLTIEAAIQLQDMGYSAERTRQAVIAVRQQTGQSIPTTEQVLTWLLDNEERENGSGMTTEFGVRPQPSETSAVATTVVGTSVPSSTISTPTTIVGTSIPTSIVNTGFGIPTTIVGTSVPTSIVGTSIPSSILNAGSSFESSSTFYTGFNAPSTLVESVSIIGTPNVHTISSTSSSTSQVGAGTTTSTVSSTSTSATAKVQPSVSSASAEGVTEGSSSATGSENNSGSHEAKGSNTEKQSAASGDSDESKQTAKDPSSNEPSNKSNKKKNGKKKAKMKPKSDTAGATGGDVDAQSLKAENEKLKEMQTCKICMERPVSTTLLPCGHLVCCETCAGRLQRCPICRKRIKGTVKTFMS